MEIELVKCFGKVGWYYYCIVRGEDECFVNLNCICKLIGVECIYFEDVSDIKVMKEKLVYFCEKVFDYMDWS